MLLLGFYFGLGRGIKGVVVIRREEFFFLLVPIYKHLENSKGEIYNVMEFPFIFIYEGNTKATIDKF